MNKSTKINKYIYLSFSFTFISCGRFNTGYSSQTNQLLYNNHFCATGTNIPACGSPLNVLGPICDTIFKNHAS